jgi:hypothetical protein
MSVTHLLDALESVKEKVENPSLVKQMVAYRHYLSSPAFIRLVNAEQDAIQTCLNFLPQNAEKDKVVKAYEILSLYSAHYFETYYKEHVLQKYVVEGDLVGVRIGSELGVDVNTQIGYLPDLNYSNFWQGLWQLMSGRTPSAWSSSWHHCTPLVLASLLGHYDIVQFLVENGARLNVETRRHNTALDWATKRGHTNIEHYLLQKGGLRSTTSDAGLVEIFASIEW